MALIACPSISLCLLRPTMITTTAGQPAAMLLSQEFLGLPVFISLASWLCHAQSATSLLSSSNVSRTILPERRRNGSQHRKPSVRSSISSQHHSPLPHSKIVPLPATRVSSRASPSSASTSTLRIRVSLQTTLLELVSSLLLKVYREACSCVCKFIFGGDNRIIFPDIL